jgi:peptide/nickel transport system permease protein
MSNESRTAVGSDSDELYVPSDEEYQADTETEASDEVGLRYTILQIRHDTTARIGLYIVTGILLVAIYATIDAQILDYQIAEQYWYHPEYDPENPEVNLPPVGISNLYGDGSWAHPLGTDHRGRDILVRLVYGSRVSIQAGVFATLIGMIGGIILGSIAGYYGGRIDDVLMRGIETMYAIPFLVVIIAFMSAVGRNLVVAMIAVSILTVPVFARLIRSEVLSVREMSYVEAAKASGLRDYQIIMRHVIPNSFASVVVQATLQVGSVILLIAGLSFLGFGAQEPTPDWGQMLAQSRGYLLPNPWFSVWPGMAILITVVAFNIVGDGLRDALDPHINNSEKEEEATAYEG